MKKETQICSRSSGFSLIEFAISVSVIALLTAVAMMSWTSPTVTVAQQAYRLGADLRYAQHLAQSTNTRLRVNFNSGTYSLTLPDGTTAKNFAAGASTVTLPVDTSLATSGLASSVPSFIVFDGLGRPYTTNTTPGTQLSSAATLTLTQAGQTATVTIQPNTGQVLP